MKCPHCGDRTAVEIDMHSSGFTAEQSPVKECGACGLVWQVKVVNGENVIDIIKQADKK
jgi:transcription elongation factor Elf1